MLDWNTRVEEADTLADYSTRLAECQKTLSSGLGADYDMVSYVMEQDLIGQ